MQCLQGLDVMMPFAGSIAAAISFPLSKLDFLQVRILQTSRTISHAIWRGRPLTNTMTSLNRRSFLEKVSTLFFRPFPQESYFDRRVNAGIALRGFASGQATH